MMKVLQLCTIIGKQIFVVHGGLWAGDPSLNFIRSIDHTEFTAPDPSTNILQEQAWNDILWSDPVTEEGIHKSHRGVGMLFGPDVTEEFCNCNPPITLVIRSH